MCPSHSCSSRSLVSGEAFALKQLRENCRDGRGERNRAPLAALRDDDAFADVDRAKHANRVSGEVDVAHAQSEKLAESQATERGGDEDRSILIVCEDVPVAVDFRRRSRCDGQTVRMIAASLVGVCVTSA